MKAILMSIKPEWCAKILNGEKTIEIRKRFPKDFVGWVYIYCTKDSKHPVAPFHFKEGWFYKEYNDNTCYAWGCPQNMGDDINGKVVARFWCNNVEDFEFCEFYKYKDNPELYNECVRKDNELCKKACIGCVQMVQYLDTKAIGKDMFGKAIHITNLEIFDEPKELSEFKTKESIAQYKKDIEESRKEDLEIHERIIRDIENCGETTWAANNEELTEECYNLGCYGLQRPPQSRCYVEVEE